MPFSGSGTGISNADDVFFSSVSDGDTLVYDSGTAKWNNGAGGSGATDLDALTDVAISSPVNGQVLKYNGADWVNASDATGGGGTGIAFLVASATAPQSVKDNASYTATGSNDQATIQQALDALPAGSGGRVICYGLFNVAAPIRIEKHGTTLAGVGTGARTNASQDSDGTKFLAASGFSGSEIVRVQLADDSAPLQGASLKDFTVDGDAVGSGVDGILFRSHSASISHVQVHRCTGSGINVKGYVDGVDGFVGTTWATYDTIIDRCIVSNCSSSGVFLNTGAQDDHVIGCILYNNLYNIRIQAGSQQITNCHTYSGGDYNIWFDGSGSRSKIVNLKCEQAGKHGIYLDGTTSGTSDVQILGSNFKNNGRSVDNTYSHIMIEGPTANGHSRTTIVGCNFSRTSGETNLAQYGVNLSSSVAQHTLVQGNNFGDGHFATAAVNEGSFSANAPLVQSNRGYTSEKDATVLVGGGAGNATVWFGGVTQPAGMASGDYWVHDA